jgi:hAT family C-terminal dimerisation region
LFVFQEVENQHIGKSENRQQQSKSKKTNTELHKDLDAAIAKAMSIHYSEKAKTNNTTMTKIIKQELTLFQTIGNRGFLLGKVYNYFLIIKPTSVEAERAFSSSGYLCNKLRTRLNDDTLDHLSCLRTYFQCNMD